MGNFLSLMANVIIGAGIVSMILILILLIYQGKVLIEKLIRCFALLFGFLVFLSAKLLKVSIPELLYEVAKTGGVLNVKMGFWLMLFPSLVGFVIAVYFSKVLLDGRGKKVNALILISTFVFCGFCDVFYVQISHDSKATAFATSIQSKEKYRDKLHDDMAGWTYSYSYSEEMRVKRIATEKEIEDINKEIQLLENSKNAAMISEFSPNIMFILGILFYVIFIFDSNQVRRLG